VHILIPLLCLVKEQSDIWSSGRCKNDIYLLVPYPVFLGCLNVMIPVNKSDMILGSKKCVCVRYAMNEYYRVEVKMKSFPHHYKAKFPKLQVTLLVT
jgi:hypothetical protein